MIKTWMSDFQPSFRATQAAMPGNALAANQFMGGYGMMRSKEIGMSNLWRKQEQLRSYWGWNYVFVFRIMTTVKFQQPLMAQKIRKAQADPLNIQSIHQRQFLQYQYGMLQDNQDDLNPITNHRILDLLRRPNVDDSWSQFISETILFQQLCGEFYWWIIRDGMGLPAEIWVVPNDMITPIQGADGTIKTWQLMAGGQHGNLIIPYGDIIRHAYKNPLSKLEGYSPSLAGGRWLDNAEQVEKSKYFTMANGGMPDVFFELDPEKYTDPTDSNVERVSEKLKSRFGKRRHGGFEILPPGIKASPISWKPREMDWANTEGTLRDNLGALRGVNKFIAGISEDMNHEQVWAALTQYYEISINPILAEIAEVITCHVCPMFDPLSEKKGIVCYFNECIPSNAEQELKENTLDWQMGAYEPDERRIDRGRQPRRTPAHEQGYMAAGLAPIGDFDPDIREEQQQADREFTMAQLEAKKNRPAEPGDDEANPDDGSSDE